jgi:hypothetical protein
MTQININLETKINTGDFNNVGLSFGIVEEVKEGEKVTETFDRVYAFLEKRLTEKAAEVSEDWEKVRTKKYGK